MKNSFASSRGWSAGPGSQPAPCAFHRERSAIIPFLASNSPFLMFLGAPRLRQSALDILVLATASAMLVSCGSNYNNLNTPGLPTEANPATIRVHVFVSNPLFSTGSSAVPVLNVVDGQLI